MLAISEQYEWCWNLGAYMGQECELCPHRNECSRNEEDEKYNENKNK